MIVCKVKKTTGAPSWVDDTSAIVLKDRSYTPKRHDDEKLSNNRSERDGTRKEVDQEPQTRSLSDAQETNDEQGFSSVTRAKTSRKNLTFSE